MGRFGVAVRAFFRILRDGSLAEQVRVLLEGPAPRPAETAPATPPPAKKAAGRSDAVNLLAALQREARFVDFVQESLAEYSDAQVGAAVRDVHRDCAAVLERLFALRPVVDALEEAQVEVPAGFDAAVYRLSGNVAGPPPYRGTLRHHGWKVTALNLPQWTGEAGSAAANVVAPAEVELR